MRNRSCIAIVDGIRARVYTCQDDTHNEPRAVCDLVNRAEPARGDFAKNVVAELDRIAREGACDRVVVVASPPMLGELHLVDRVLHRDDLVLEEISRDVAKPPSRPHGCMIAAILVVSALFAACASDGGSTGDDDAPPFTDGTSTLAGAGSAGYVDGTRAESRFNNPVNVKVGPDGNIYVADFDNGKLRIVDTEGNTKTLVIQAGFTTPFGLAFIGSKLYVQTDGNPTGQHSMGSMTGTIWEVNPQTMTARPIIVNMGRPRGLIALKDGRLAASDYEHHVIQTIDPGNAEVETLAGTWNMAGYADGTGAAARFNIPYGMVQREDGSLIVCDSGNNRLRVVTLQGQVTTLAGSGESGFADGAMLDAMMQKPEGITMASNGDIYVADTYNARIRKITGSSITTIAGDGKAGWMDNDDPMQSELYGLEGLSISADGKMLYVADGTRGEPVPFNRIRVIKLAD